jgi:hypothetical protein
MNCRICSPPGPGICPECEAEVKRQAKEITRRIQGRVGEVLVRLEVREMLKERRVG